jgi:hypothetical protein
MTVSEAMAFFSTRNEACADIRHKRQFILRRHHTSKGT